MIDYENGAAFNELYYENLEDGEDWEDDESFDDIDLSLEDE